MPRFIDDESFRLAFSVNQQPGVYALLLGSGLSSAAGIPTGWGITIDLIRRVGALRGETAERTDAEWEMWYRQQTGRSPDYSELLAELAPRPAERQPIIASYIVPSAEDRAEARKLPTQAHHAIARLVAGGYIRVILTTNFDRLLENALRDAGVEPVVIASPDQCYGAQPLQHVPSGSCTVIKLHGDYLDVRSLNTAEELAMYQRNINRLLSRIFGEYGLLICGWSGIWDTALRNAILRAPGRRYSTWWASLGPLADPAKKLVRHRDARLVPIDGADGFFSRLADQVELIDQTCRPPPGSVELLVAAAKRYLSKPEPRIELADLIQDQVKGIASVLRSPALDPNQSYNPDSFCARVRLLDAQVEGLACMFFLMGKWSRGETDRHATEAMINLYGLSQRLPYTGSSAYLALCSYPAVLCFAMYSAGLVSVERWTELRNLCDARARDHQGIPRPLVERLLSTAWERTHRMGPGWMPLASPGSTRPFQEHLSSLLKAWLYRLAGDSLDVEQHLCWTDLLCAFVMYAQNGGGTLHYGLSTGRPIPVLLGSWCQDARLLRNLDEDLTDRHPLVAQYAEVTGLLDMFKETIRTLG